MLQWFQQNGSSTAALESATSKLTARIDTLGMIIKESISMQIT